MNIPDYPFATDWQEPIPDYLLHDPYENMSDEELAEYFADSEADRWIEEQKSNPGYYEP